jgi:hypothetical protein
MSSAPWNRQASSTADTDDLVDAGDAINDALDEVGAGTPSDVVTFGAGAVMLAIQTTLARQPITASTDASRKFSELLVERSNAAIEVSTFGWMKSVRQTAG